MRELSNYVGNKWIMNRGAERLKVVDPATEQAVAEFQLSDASAVEEAVDVAKDAQVSWGALSLEERIGAVTRSVANLSAHVDELADLERVEMGRPASVGRDWIVGAVRSLQNCIDVASRYEFVREILDGPVRTTVAKRPLGVAALIVPWNFPTNAILGALGPLLLSGNTVVLKPSEKSPLSAVRLVELLNLPDGVVNLVLGDGRTGAALVESSDIGLVHFTGSVAVGKAIAASSGNKLRRTVLELGGKDAVIVDADVDVASVAKDVAFGSFTNTGQICTSMERIYVHRDISEDFIAALVDAASEYRWDVPNAQLGPLVDPRQRDLVERHVSEALAAGAIAAIGGRRPDGPGYFYPATVLTGVTDDMAVMREETFGPVAPVQIVDSFTEALEKAASTEFGLTATAYSLNEAHITAAADLPVGILWINGWQISGHDVVYEPAGDSGLTPTGHFAAFDAATRPISLIARAPISEEEHVPPNDPARAPSAQPAPGDLFGIYPGLEADMGFDS